MYLLESAVLDVAILLIQMNAQCELSMGRYSKVDSKYSAATVHVLYP